MKKKNLKQLLSHTCYIFCLSKANSIFLTRSFLLVLLLLTNLYIRAQNRIFITVSGGDLYSVDIPNCNKYLIGSTGIGLGDIAFTTNGSLWGVSNGQLFKIDTTNASTTLIGDMGIFPVSLVGVNDSILLAEDQGDLYGINTNNANSYYIGEIGYYANGDLVLYDGSVYMFTPFIKIEMNNSFTEITNVHPINLTMPICEGAAILDDDYLSIIGFSGIGIVELCQTDGSYHIVCPDLDILGAPGAASITQYSNSTDLINVFTPNGDGINDFFQPFGELYNVNSVVIFNRWGNVVSNLSYPFIWDGHSQNGSEIIEGVYYYIIEKTADCRNKIYKQSMIQLFR